MLIDELKQIQARHGWLPRAELEALRERTRIPLWQIHGVASFYPHFHLEPPPPLDVRVCADLSCQARDRSLQATLAGELAHTPGARVRRASCLGRCEAAPVVAVNDHIYTDVDARAFARTLSTGGAPPEPALAPWANAPHMAAPEPWAALRAWHAGTLDATKVLAELNDSGLRGMGGAGFPTARKWALVRETAGPTKYVVCNADESEPGTFKDRVILQALPERMLEGMVLCARIVGAAQCIVFVRHEYHRETERVRAALAAMEPRFLEGLTVEVFESPGGYICGEETALLEALEGKRAEPRDKPPFPGTHGLWQKPTVINNVETFAWVPLILQRGGAWFSAQGTNGARGLKLIALSGHVARAGVYEVPLGTSVRALIDGHGGGMTGAPLKAFAPGGASSGFLPASLADTPLDFAPMAKLGSMLGSGAVVALAEGTCLVDLALGVTRFFRHESCGKCVPCRTGTEQLTGMLERATRGQPLRLELAEELADTMALTSICGLGQAAPNAFVSLMKHFRAELEDHLTVRRCSTCFPGTA